MRTYYEITEYFYQALSAIKDVRTVLNVDVIDNKFEVANYPTALAVVSVEPTASENSHVAYSVRIEVVDMIDVSNDDYNYPDKYVGNNNTIDVYNSTLAIVRRIHLQLVNKTTGSNAIQVGESPDIEKLFDASQNVAGTAINMTINVDDGIMDLCENDTGEENENKASHVLVLPGQSTLTME